MSYERRDDFELPCSECHVLTRVALLGDASRVAPFAGLVCPDCEDRLTADDHDDEACACDVCRRERTRDRSPVPKLRIVPKDGDDVGF